MRQRQIFQKKPRKGEGPQYLKYLVIVAVSLTLLVIVVPYLIKDKNKEISKRPVSERGTVTREIPKQTEQPAPEKLSEPGKLPAPAGPPETNPQEPPAPEAIKPPEIQPAPKAQEPRLAAPQKRSPSETPPEGKTTAPEKAPSSQAKSAEPGPKDLFPKKSAPPEAPATTAPKGPPIKPEAKAGGPPSAPKPAPALKPAPAVKPAPTTEKGDYAVQVGTIIKDRSKAEAVRKDLATKGYNAVIRTAADGNGYLVTTNPCPESKAYTLLEQMKIQGLSNTKVIKVGPAPEPAKKPVPQGQATPADKVHRRS